MSWLVLILKYFPVVLSLIAEIQKLFPKTPGVVKRTMLLNIVNPPPQDREAVGKLVDKTVASLQTAKVMTKDSSAVVGK